MTNRYQKLLVAVAVLGSFSVSTLRAEEEDDKGVPVDQLPAAVKEAVKKVLGTAEAEKVKKEDEDGKTVYEVEFEVGDVDHSATVAEDGTVLEQETELATTDLSDTVKAALAKAEPKGAVKSAASVTAGGKTFVEVDLMVGDEKHEVQVTDAGEVLSNVVEKEDQDDHDDKAEHGDKHEHGEKDKK